MRFANNVFQTHTETGLAIFGDHSWFVETCVSQPGFTIQNAVQSIVLSHKISDFRTDGFASCGSHVSRVQRGKKETWESKNEPVFFTRPFLQAKSGYSAALSKHECHLNLNKVCYWSSVMLFALVRGYVIPFVLRFFVFFSFLLWWCGCSVCGEQVVVW